GLLILQRVEQRAQRRPLADAPQCERRRPPQPGVWLAERGDQPTQRARAADPPQRGGSARLDGGVGIIQYGQQRPDRLLLPQRTERIRRRPLYPGVGVVQRVNQWFNRALATGAPQRPRRCLPPERVLMHERFEQQARHLLADSAERVGGLHADVVRFIAEGGGEQLDGRPFVVYPCGDAPQRFGCCAAHAP